MKVDNLVGFKMMKKFSHNRNGTAEVIGSIMFIVILLFFFTNVYLWHDAATKEMDDLHVDRMNARMELSYNIISGVKTLTVTANGSDVTLSRLWIVEESGSRLHLYANLTDLNGNGMKIDAGKSITLKIIAPDDPTGPTEYVKADVSGNTATIHYNLDVPVTCSVINNLGIAVSAYCT